MKQLLDFLDALEEKSIYFRLNKIRDSILVEIAVPGERWEVEFFEDDTVLVEKFLSTGNIEGRSALDDLFAQFSD